MGRLLGGVFVCLLINGSLTSAEGRYDFNDRIAMSDVEEGSFFSYGRNILGYDGPICNAPLIVFVADAGDQITVGTCIWRNPTLTLPYPDGIITSATAPTIGHSFRVENGCIVETAWPC